MISWFWALADIEDTSAFPLAREPNLGCAVKSLDLQRMRGCHSSGRRQLLQCGDNINEKNRSIFTNPKRNLMKARFLMGTMLSAVVWGSLHATPLDKALVVAQAPPQE